MRRGFSANVIVRPPTFYPQPLARDVPQQSLITHHTLRVKVHIIIRVVYAITHGVDHAWWDGPFLVHATACGVNHFWCELKLGHPISRSVHQRWSIPPGVVHSHQGEVSGKGVTEPSWRATRKKPCRGAMHVGLMRSSRGASLSGSSGTECCSTRNLG